MLFNSYTFIFIFLPLTALLFHLLRHQGYLRTSLLVLVLASLTYYGWWNPKYLILLIGLISLNFGLAKSMFWARRNNAGLLKPFLVLGITANLAILGYYKYANFFIDNVNYFFNTGFFLQTIVLPIGISFFTFQKIGLLVDIYQNKLAELNLLDYSLFVTFFPQLIAGPITHHSEVMPQFKNLKTISYHTICLGITIFVIGLAKKTVLADSAAHFASEQFNAAAQGRHLDFLAAWSAALAYTVQLYFDFSAYSDMAIGIGQLFGIRLPLNFNSPYKSKSIIEFWQRWHMTLSRFLRDYLYIPLGGNRCGKLRRYLNLLITMLLGGIWHGAGWTFVIWGLLHGTYLMINHGWRALTERSGMVRFKNGFIAGILSQGLTFLAVVIGWVFFRAVDLPTALDILKSMTGLYGFKILTDSIADPRVGIIVAAAMLMIAWFAPNTQELTGYIGPEYAPAKGRSRHTAGVRAWQPTLGWAIYTGFLFALSLMMFSKVSEFIYFQF